MFEYDDLGEWGRFVLPGLSFFFLITITIITLSGIPTYTQQSRCGTTPFELSTTLFPTPPPRI